MKKRLWIFGAVLLCVLLVVVPMVQAGITSSSSSPKSAGKANPGIEAAQTLSMITGVAISPLLGVGAVGAWKYFETPEDKRANLVWYAQPWFWVPALMLVGLVFLKDSLGTAAPTVLKKPLDVAETIENKISGLVATGAFVPLVVALMGSENVHVAGLSPAGFAAIDFSPVLKVLLVPVAMAAFVIVWMASHAINILILLSPFTTVDAALKTFRTFILSTVVVTSFANPYVGAIWALILIFISYFLAGWSFRLTTFGTLFVWDYITFGRTRFKPAPDGNWMFLAREINQAPIRTYGRLVKESNGDLVFHYRPWLFLPKQTLKLPAGEYAVGRGLFYPEVVQVVAGEAKAVMVLPPRYVTHEEELARAYGFAGVCDVGLLKGFKALWNFLKGLFGMRQPAAATA